MQENKTVFTKSFVPVGSQIEILKSRGLHFLDFKHANQCLNSVSYYRLSAYFKAFYITNNTHHNFRPNTSFEIIWGLYTFDRELRLCLSDPIERIEVALRTALINALSEPYGDLWYLSTEPFLDKWSTSKSKPNGLCEQLKKEVNALCKSQKEDFIKHYYQKYAAPPYPPSWMLLECLSFGKCTSFFRHLKRISDKRKVCEIFELHPRVVESCLEPLRYLRNLCAHHSRVWNRWFLYRPIQSKAFGNIISNPNSFHEQAVMLHYFNQTISPHSAWKERLYELFCRYEEIVPYQSMGFNSCWNTDPFWDL